MTRSLPLAIDTSAAVPILRDIVMMDASAAAEGPGGGGGLLATTASPYLLLTKTTTTAAASDLDKLEQEIHQNSMLLNGLHRLEAANAAAAAAAAAARPPASKFEQSINSEMRDILKGGQSRDRSSESRSRSRSSSRSNGSSSTSSHSSRSSTSRSADDVDDETDIEMIERLMDVNSLQWNRIWTLTENQMEVALGISAALVVFVVIVLVFLVRVQRRRLWTDKSVMVGVDAEAGFLASPSIHEQQAAQDVLTMHV